MTREKCVIYVCWDCVCHITDPEDYEDVCVDGNDHERWAWTKRGLESNWSEWNLLIMRDKAGPELQDEQAEDPYFSWSHCEGCDSSLGGDRHAMLAYRDVHDLELLAEVAGR